MQICAFYIYIVNVAIRANSCVTAHGFKQRARKFSQMMVNVSPRHTE